MNRGFDEFRGFVGGAVDHHTHIATHGLHALDWWHDRRIENQQGYSTDLLTRHATEFIDRNAGTPFFLCLAHAAPHEPLQGRDPSRTAPQPAVYRETIESLDDSVAAVMAKLDERGLTRDTLVVFCSDNGPQPPRGQAAEGPWKLLGEHDAPTMLVNLTDDLGEKRDRLAQRPERAERLMSHHREWTAAVGVR